MGTEVDTPKDSVRPGIFGGLQEQGGTGKPGILGGLHGHGGGTGKPGSPVRNMELDMYYFVFLFE